MNVNVVWDPGPSATANVDPHVESFRSQALCESYFAEPKRFEDIEDLCLAQLSKASDVTYWRHHEMAVIVRIAVQSYDAPLGTMNHELTWVIAGRDHVAENAIFGHLVRQNILQPPRCEKDLHPTRTSKPLKQPKVAPS
jgi:hypothetical protein